MDLADTNDDLFSGAEPKGFDGQKNVPYARGEANANPLPSRTLCAFRGIAAGRNATAQGRDAAQTRSVQELVLAALKRGTSGCAPAAHARPFCITSCSSARSANALPRVAVNDGCFIDDSGGSQQGAMNGALCNMADE
ncbi:MAG: hypothetical protein NVS9B2_27810 [Steroidobacteraceae bacterium]